MIKFYIDPNENNELTHFMADGDSPPVDGLVGYTAAQLSLADDWIPDFDQYTYRLENGALVQSDVVEDPE